MLVGSLLQGALARHYAELPGFLPHANTFVKLEGLTVTGSIKHRTALSMLDALESAGRIRPGSELIESTSGNLGVALASICAARGYRITLVTDPNANAQSVRYMRALGAEIVIVGTRGGYDGYLHSRIAYIERRLAESPTLVWPNQYASRANIDAHRLGTGAEIVAEFGRPDWLFVSVGTSGTLMGLVAHMREIGAATKVIGVDVVGSIVFGGAAGPRWLPGAGASRRPEIFTDDGSFGKITVPEAEAVRMCRRVARRHGLLLGGSTGLVLAAASALSSSIPPGSTVLAVSPDMGERYLETVYDDGWVSRNFGPDLLANEALEGLPTHD
ncbi:pyridoxal-phosphate dependent enzyme [Pseudosporangium ferrugineum]|uniref:Cysteine synthase A n=1 Tax=Pseudosporangium ferrugineum TaxID=439699 RepID=A0A2T0RFG4_9ACTN|nr:pyridoxal-phosphate dependent enzyme [Pseudosporangium ferrugineum]PRY19887.1 cysteine synthase A [Pseudosporangium ferrugineum]